MNMKINHQRQSNKQSGGHKSIGRGVKDNIAAYLFLAPWLIGLFVFTLWPFLNSLLLSFQDTNLFTSEFVGLNNYIKMVTDDPKFIKSLWVTLKFVFVSVPLKLTFALLVAMLLKNEIRGMSLYRTVIYIPSLIGASVAVAVMWTQLFGRNGIINDVLSVFGVEKISWISNPKTALSVLVILYVWQFGSSMVIFLSGLKNIPNSLYEACMVDGGGKIASFFNITLPMLSPIILFNFILQTIGSFQVFTQAFLITKGGPMNETNFMVLYIYDKAFQGQQMGYASAMSWALLMVIVATTGVIFLTSKHWVFYES